MENFERTWQIGGNLTQLLSKTNHENNSNGHDPKTNLVLVNRLLVYTGYRASERFHEDLKTHIQLSFGKELNLTLLHSAACGYLANAGDSIMLKFAENPTSYLCNLQIRLQCNNRRVRLQVDDNGKGIDEGVEPFLFSQEKSTKRSLSEKLKGVLLGFDGYSLHQARHIATKFNGRVGYHNKGKDNGATFWYEIPVLGIPNARALRPLS